MCEDFIKHIKERHIKDLIPFFDFLPIYDIIKSEQMQLNLEPVVSYLYDIIESEESFLEVKRYTVQKYINRQKVGKYPTRPNGKNITHLMYKNTKHSDFKNRAIQILILINELNSFTLIDWDRIQFHIPDYLYITVDIEKELKKDPIDGTLPKYLMEEPFCLNKKLTTR